MQIILLELSGSTWTNIVQLHLERGCDPSGDIVSVCSRVCMPACSLCIALLFVQPGVNSFNISFLLMQRKKKSVDGDMLVDDNTGHICCTMVARFDMLVSWVTKHAGILLTKCAGVTRRANIAAHCGMFYHTGEDDKLCSHCN